MIGKQNLIITRVVIYTEGIIVAISLFLCQKISYSFSACLLYWTVDLNSKEMLGEWGQEMVQGKENSLLLIFETIQSHTNVCTHTHKIFCSSLFQMLKSRRAA